MNGVAERANRTLMNLTRTSLHSAHLPQRFWAEAVVTAAYILNRVPHSILQNAVPDTIWTGHTPSVRHLRVFGCLAYACRPSQGRRKLDMRAGRCILVGYSKQTRGYRLWDPDRNDVIQTKHVRFDEKRIGYEVIYSSQSCEQDVSNGDISHDGDWVLTSPTLEVSAQGSDEMDMDDDEESQYQDNADVKSVPVLQKHAMVRSSPPLTRARAATMMKPNEQHEVNLNLLEISEPSTIEEAFESPQAPLWRAAVQDELDTLAKHKTWEVVDLPPGKRLIGCKWVFKVKNDASGGMQRYRARLAAQGFSQRKNIDYKETYSPVANFAIFRLMLVLASFFELVTRHLDVKCAYLYGELNEELYMHLPPGTCDKASENKVAKLLRPIYGLKQSGRNWNETLNKMLQENGCRRLLSSSCVYIHGRQTILVIYVDDIVIFAPSNEEVERVLNLLKNVYDLKDLGEVSYLLGVKIDQHVDGSFRLCQMGYIKSILSRFNMTDCRTASTPLENGVVLSTKDCPKETEEMNTVPYIELIGCLMHLAISTRPDILFAVVKLAQFNQNPGKIHWNAGKRILRYLQLTTDYELILYPKSNKIRLFSDADWGSDIDDRRSVSGLLVTLGDCPIFWKSKKQTNVSTSTMEAEYCALAQATKEALWLSTFLKELNLSEVFPIPYTLLCDNKSAIDFSKSHIENSRTKHIDISYHLTREKLKEGLLDLHYVPTNKNAADIFTKGLGKN